MHRFSERKKFIVFLPFFLILILLFFQYSNSFPQGDDFTFIVKGGSIHNILSFYGYYYMVAGSRMANMLAQFLLLSGLNVWKILTPLVICGISVLFFYYIKGYLISSGENTSGSVQADFSLAAVCAIFPGLVPLTHNLFGDTFLWMDGSCNYLYPFFFMLIGFLPVYNAVRERPVPRFFRYVSPVCFCIAGLLHEQMALLTFGMCIAASAYLLISKKMTKYIGILSILSFAIVVFTLTCPGAYYRLRTVGQQSKSHGLKGVIFRNLPIYFGDIFNNCGFWIVLIGLCALYLLYHTSLDKKKIYSFYSFYLIAGGVLFLMSGMLRLPQVQENLAVLNSRIKVIADAAAIAYWLVYLLVCFIVMLTVAKHEKNYRYVVILFVGIWCSQAIPAVIGSWGRPLLPMILLVFLMAVSLFHNIQYRHLKAACLSIASVGLCSMIISAGFTVKNYRSYADIIRQVNDVKDGKSSTVVIDNRKFKKDYMYFNAFSSAYWEIKVYYGLPKDATIKFIS